MNKITTSHFTRWKNGDVLAPAKQWDKVFGITINRVSDNLNANPKDLHLSVSGNGDLTMDAKDMLKPKTKLQAIKALRERHCLSLVDAKNIVDSAE